MKIKIAELEKVLSDLLAELHEQKCEEIEIDKEDFYWAISKEELYNPYNQPNQLTLGQLSDDLEHIHKIFEKKLPIVCYDFAKISYIFLFIGNKNIF